MIENGPRGSITQEELGGPVIVRVRKSGSPSGITRRRGLRKSLRGLDYLVDSPSKGALQTSLRSLEFQKEACSSV